MVAQHYNNQRNQSEQPDRRSTSLFEGIRERFQREPNKLLIVGSYESMTYAGAYYRIRALAKIFRDGWEIGPKSTIMISAPNVTWYVLILAAAQLCGARIVLCPYGYNREDFIKAVRLSNPSLVIIASKKFEDRLLYDLPDLPLASVTYTSSNIPRIENLVAHGMSTYDYIDDVLAYESHIVLFSSGSTGEPKLIVNRSSSFRRSGLAQATAMETTSEDICYIPVPFSHTYGIVSLYTAVECGCTILTTAQYHPDVSLAFISELKATLYFGVPTMYLRELTANEDDKWDLSSLRCGLVAGSSCPEEVFKEYEKRYGCKLVQCYGLTEAAATLTAGNINEPMSVRSHTDGKPIEGVTLKILPDTGEILCKTLSLMDGIIQSDGSLYLPLDDDGWFHTGDVGSFDDQGNLSITGRIKDIIIRGGVNIFPAEVENIYQSSEDVEASCLVGYPDPELGERTCLCVVLKPGHDATSTDLRLFAKGKIEKCMIPDVVLKMNDLPRLSNGKIDKATLRKRALGILKTYKFAYAKQRS